MKLKCKRALSILLVIIFMLTIVSPTMQTPAEAANPAIAIEGISLIVWVLGLLGITFASTGAQYEAGQQAYNDIPEFKLWVDNNTQYVNPTTGQMILSKNALAELATTVLAKVKAYFSASNTTITVPDTKFYTYYSNVLYTEKTSFSSAQDVYNYCPYTMKNINLLTVNGVSYKFELFKYNADTQYEYYQLLMNNDYIWTTVYDETLSYEKTMRTALAQAAKQANVTASKITNVKYGFRLYNNVLMVMFAYQWIDTSGLLHYVSNSQPVQQSNCVPYLSSQSGTISKDVEFKTAIDYSLEELKQTINKIAESITGTLTIPLDDPNWDATHGKTEVENPDTAVPAVPTTNWAEIWDALGIKDLIKTLTQNKPVTIEESDFKAPQLPTSIIDKFPFCVPFDLIAIVQTLNATPVAPSFTIPMRFDSINYTENFTIDLSGNDWNRVGKVIRWGNTLLFLAGLILITRKVIQA